MILAHGKNATLSVERMNGESERSKSAVLLAGVDAPNDGGDESGPEPRDARRLLQLQLSYVRVGSSGRRKHDEEDGGGSRPESEDRLRHREKKSRWDERRRWNEEEKTIPVGRQVYVVRRTEAEAKVAWR